MRRLRKYVVDIVVTHRHIPDSLAVCRIGLCVPADRHSVFDYINGLVAKHNAWEICWRRNDVGYDRRLPTFRHFSDDSLRCWRFGRRVYMCADRIMAVVIDGVAPAYAIGY